MYNLSVLAMALRKRCQPFSEIEQNFLLETIAEHGSLLESNGRSSSTLDKKDNVWVAITKAFNDEFPLCSRTTTQLRQLYKRMKISAKQEYFAHKREARATGGGPSRDLCQKTESLLKIVPSLKLTDCTCVHSLSDSVWL